MRMEPVVIIMDLLKARDVGQIRGKLAQLCWSQAAVKEAAREGP